MHAIADRVHDRVPEAALAPACRLRGAAAVCESWKRGRPAVQLLHVAQRREHLGSLRVLVLRRPPCAWPAWARTHAAMSLGSELWIANSNGLAERRVTRAYVGLPAGGALHRLEAQLCEAEPHGEARQVQRTSSTGWLRTYMGQAPNSARFSSKSSIRARPRGRGRSENACEGGVKARR